MTPDLDKGGAQVQLKNIVLESKVNGLSVEVINLGSSNSDLARVLDSNNIKVHNLNVGVNGILSAIKFIALYFHKNKNNSILLQSWMYHCNLLSVMCKMFKRDLKIIWSIRRSDIPSKKNTRIIAYLCSKFSHIIPNVILTNSLSGMKNHINYGFCENKMRFLPNLIDTDKHNFDFSDRLSIRNELGIPEKDIVLISVGRLNYDKGYDIACEALSGLKYKCHYIFIGRDVSKIDFKKYHINKNVKINLIEEVSDPTPYFSASDIFILPSRTEGFPNVLVEAMSNGKYCICTDVGDTKSIMRSESNIVAKENSRELLKKINEAMDMSKSSRDKVSQALKKLAFDNYSKEKVFKNYLSIYYDL